MKLGWVGQGELNKFYAGKDIKVYQKRTRSKKHMVYINEKVGLQEYQIAGLLNATGLGEKLTANDMPAVIAFCRSIVLTDRGFDND
jgi:hypothetical protein